MGKERTEMKQERKGVYIDGKYLVLNVRYPYDIELNRIDTPQKVQSWIVHLLEKNWITREILFDMIDVLQNHFGYDLRNMEETIA
jgi:hypothetical protein